MVLVTDLILLFSFQGTKYEKLRGEIHNQETAQEILQLTRRASTEERSVQRYMSTAGCEQQHSQMENPQAENPVTIARRSHLFPSRTQKLSSLAPMILGGKLPGKVGRCRFIWLHGQAVKTPPFHGGNSGSIPDGVTRNEAHCLYSELFFHRCIPVVQYHFTWTKTQNAKSYAACVFCSRQKKADRQAGRKMLQKVIKSDKDRK